MAKVLEHISAQARVRIVLYGRTDETVTVEMRQQPVEAALRWLFRGRNIAWFYSSKEPGRPPHLREILILDRGAGTAERPAIFAGQNAPLDPAAGDSALRTDEETDGSRFAALAGQLRVEDDPEKRARAAAELGRTWDEKAVAPLAEALARDQNAEVREAAAKALGRSWSDKAVEPLMEALTADRDARVREQAARALAHTAGQEAVPALTRALSGDRRWFVRDAAAAALETIGGRDALEALAGAAGGDRDGWVKETAAMAVLGDGRRSDRRL